MIKNDLKRFRLRDQLSADFLKAFSLIEKTLLAFMLIALVFIFLEKIGLIGAFFVGGVIGGSIGFLAITAKKMYYDEAFSELTIRTNIKQDILKSAMFAIGYSEKEYGVYSPKKKMFSAFFYCKSEIITHKTQGECCIFTGPYNKLLKISNTIPRGSPTEHHI